MTAKRLGNKLYNWASILETDTLAQALRTSEMPFVSPHLALMPDAHFGKGATVGSVIPTVGAIIPAAVGVDIGCGMIAVRTEYRVSDLPEDRRSLRLKIEESIPLSAGKYNTELTDTAAKRRQELIYKAMDLGVDLHAPHVAKNWDLQLGSLGSGNHFIEVSTDEENRVWLFLHSGSRGVGNKIAQHHIDVARALAKQYFIPLPDPDLAYLIENTPEFDQYMSELEWAQRFAFLNREEMMDRVISAFSDWMGVSGIEEVERINCHHNYTQKERHFGRDVWLSRKGAIDAHPGVLGLVPGSMGTRSYVVEGLGNPLSFHSSPHGAGREYSRAQARKTFTYEQLAESMEGIEWSGSDAFRDEIPAAYKDVDRVMTDASDLVRPLHILRALINVKGD